MKRFSLYIFLVLCTATLLLVTSCGIPLTPPPPPGTIQTSFLQPNVFGDWSDTIAFRHDFRPGLNNYVRFQLRRGDEVWPGLFYRIVEGDLSRHLYHDAHSSSHMFRRERVTFTAGASPRLNFTNFCVDTRYSSRVVNSYLNLQSFAAELGVYDNGNWNGRLLFPELLASQRIFRPGTHNYIVPFLHVNHFNSVEFSFSVIRGEFIVEEGPGENINGE